MLSAVPGLVVDQAEENLLLLGADIQKFQRRAVSAVVNHAGFGLEETQMSRGAKAQYQFGAHGRRVWENHEQSPTAQGRGTGAKLFPAEREFDEEVRTNARELPSGLIFQLRFLLATYVTGILTRRWPR